MKTILVPIDFSPVADLVVENAEKMARAFDAEVCLIHIEAPEPEFVGYEVGPQTVRDAVAHEIKTDHERLHAIRDKMIEDGIQAKALIFQGVTVDKIVEEATKINADLIVMGSHGRGALLHLLLGSVSEGVIKNSTCPVVVVPTPR